MFSEKITTFKSKQYLVSKSCLVPLHPFLDETEILRVDGRGNNSKLCFAVRHHVILSRKHKITNEQVKLLHGGANLLAASLSHHFHVVGARKVIRSITHVCTVCQCSTSKPHPQMFGQLPSDQLSPEPVFQHTGVDYAGRLLIKGGPVQ